MSRLHYTHPSTVRTHTQTATGAAVASLVAGALFVAVVLAAVTAPGPTLAVVAALATLQALLRADVARPRLAGRLYALVRPAAA